MNKSNIFRSLKKQGALFSFGAGGYYLLEVLYRGYSHWTMALCGGTCLCAICFFNKKLSKSSILLRAGVGAAIITTVEFICGCIVNLKFKMSVWDYSYLPMNVLGQICLPFTVIWFIISAILCKILSILKTNKN